MVKLRLKRIGRKHEPYYRIVATDSRSPRDGRCIEELGWFNPKAKDVLYKINSEGIKKWLSNGAQPSYAVKSILIKEGIVERDKKDIIERKGKRPLKNPEKRRKNRKQVKTESSESVETAEEKSEA